MTVNGDPGDEVTIPPTARVAVGGFDDPHKKKKKEKGRIGCRVRFSALSEAEEG